MFVILKRKKGQFGSRPFREHEDYEPFGNIEEAQTHVTKLNNSNSQWEYFVSEIHENI